jgi:hypothetical protein
MTTSADVCTILQLECCSNFHLLGPLRQCLPGRQLNKDVNVHREVYGRVLGLSPGPYLNGMYNIISWWNKPNNIVGDYVER